MMTTSKHPNDSTSPTTETTRKTSYYKTHKEARDRSHRKWLEKNRERWNAYMRERRANGK